MDACVASSNAAAALPTPEALVGEFRRLGPFGPVYKIVGVHAHPGGDVRLRALVLETGEAFERRYELALRDPAEE